MASGAELTPLREIVANVAAPLLVSAAMGSVGLNAVAHGPATRWGHRTRRCRSLASAAGRAWTAKWFGAPATWASRYARNAVTATPSLPHVSGDVIPQRVAVVLWEPGYCWLCRLGGIPVQWLGPVTTPSGHGEMYGCGACVRGLDHDVRTQDKKRDTAPAR